MSLSLCALLFLACSVFSANGYKFYVGGKRGWTVNPDESYSHWAERNRFQVNDTLYFKYEKHTDSVLVVRKKDFNNCNTNKPIHKLDSGESVFKFPHSGPFFFITSNLTNCQKGQKLIVVVLAVHPPPHVQPPASPPTSPVPDTPVPSSNPPAVAPWAYAPAPKKSASAAMAETTTFVVSAFCVLLGLFVISG
ncbi:unnamed protein product [Rhodiola kirilowii]